MTMSRSFLFAALVAFCAMFSGVSATFSQGALQLTRDYGIKVRPADVQLRLRSQQHTKADS